MWKNRTEKTNENLYSNYLQKGNIFPIKAIRRTSANYVGFPLSLCNPPPLPPAFSPLSLFY